MKDPTYMVLVSASVMTPERGLLSSCICPPQPSISPRCTQIVLA